ncbi:hypothetical protein ACNGYR_002119 [Serratia marcescens]
MNFYIVTFERDAKSSYKDFHEEFTGSKSVKKWWHYITSCYLIGSNMSASAISRDFKDAAKKHNLNLRHIVMSVDLNDRQGWLPPKAWDWIRHNSDED